MALDCLLDSMIRLDKELRRVHIMFLLDRNIRLDTSWSRTRCLAMGNRNRVSMVDIRLRPSNLQKTSWCLLGKALAPYCQLDSSGLEDKCRSS